MKNLICREIYIRSLIIKKRWLDPRKTVKVLSGYDNILLLWQSENIER